MNDEAINTETRDKFILDTLIREAKKLDAAAPPPLPGNRLITFYHSDPFVVGEAANKIGLNASVFRKTCEAADPDEKYDTYSMIVEALVVGDLVVVVERNTNNKPPVFKKIKTDWFDQDKLAQSFYENAKQMGYPCKWSEPTVAKTNLRTTQQELAEKLAQHVKIALAMAQKDVIEKSLGEKMNALSTPAKKM